MNCISENLRLQLETKHLHWKLIWCQSSATARRCTVSTCSIIYFSEQLFIIMQLRGGGVLGREGTNLIVKLEHYSKCVLLLSIFASNTVSISQIFKKKRALSNQAYIMCFLLLNKHLWYFQQLKSRLNTIWCICM